MSTLMIAHDSHLLMLELAVEKLIVPKESPFDDVILGKYIVSFRFLDGDWIDVVPNRPDHRIYRGSCGEEQTFHGGKSVVLSVPSCYLREDSIILDDLTLQIRARREISRYFQVESLTKDLGKVDILVQELLADIIDELRLRRELEGFLSVAHERDPISRSMKDRYCLECAETCEPTGCQLLVYVRLSYLGGCVITEIDRFSSDLSAPFYAQEETNKGPAYECRELDPKDVRPTKKRETLSLIRGRCDLVCECTDEQRYRMLMGDKICQGTTTECEEEDECKDDGGEQMEDKGTATENETDDKGVDALDKCKKKKKKFSDEKELSPEELSKLLKSLRRGTGGATVGIVDRCRRVEPRCEPLPVCCSPVEICMLPKEPVCLTVDTNACMPSVCCYD